MLKANILSKSHKLVLNYHHLSSPQLCQTSFLRNNLFRSFYSSYMVSQPFVKNPRYTVSFGLILTCSETHFLRYPHANSSLKPLTKCHLFSKACHSHPIYAATYSSHSIFLVLIYFFFIHITFYHLICCVICFIMHIVCASLKYIIHEHKHLRSVLFVIVFQVHRNVPGLYYVCKKISIDYFKWLIIAFLGQMIRK